jgi:hypothetical protein
MLKQVVLIATSGFQKLREEHSFRVFENRALRENAINEEIIYTLHLILLG